MDADDDMMGESVAHCTSASILSNSSMFDSTSSIDCEIEAACSIADRVCSLELSGVSGVSGVLS